MTNELKIISGHKLICFSGKKSLFSKGNTLYVSDGLYGKERRLGKLPVNRLKGVLAKSSLCSRVLRLEIRCGIFISDEEALVSYSGAIYRIDCLSGNILLEHRFMPEMNNPLNFTYLKGLEGFSDGIYYGEYFQNANGSEVNIYRRDNDGNWDIVYTFEAGSIYHIHGIIPNYQKGKLYVLSGDKDDESAIWECTDNFAKVIPLVRGSQKYRACVALPANNGLIYATDTPLEQNYLYFLDYRTKEIKKIMEIDGPAIYGKNISDSELLFSTSVEPDSRIEGWRYLFTYKIGEGVKNRNSKVYRVRTDGETIECKELFVGAKDCLPMGLAQFGTWMFPNGQGEVTLTGQSIKKYSNKTILLDK